MNFLRPFDEIIAQNPLITQKMSSNMQLYSQKKIYLVTNKNNSFVHKECWKMTKLEEYYKC